MLINNYTHDTLCICYVIYSKCKKKIQRNIYFLQVQAFRKENNLLPKKKLISIKVPGVY